MASTARPGATSACALVVPADRAPAGSDPASVYRITFTCECDEEHDGLVTHGELDWEPLTAAERDFFNVMTRRLESVAGELLDRAAGLIRAGIWPWSFVCYPEDRARPTFPSAFRLLSPGADGVGVAVRCPSCSRTSVNLVTRRAPRRPVLQRSACRRNRARLPPDHELTLAAFREELDSSSFDARRRRLVE